LTEFVARCGDALDAFDRFGAVQLRYLGTFSKAVDAFYERVNRTQHV
jgi:hypothetical protein